MGEVSSRIRLSRVLPIVQVVVTATVTVWADRMDWILFANTTRAPGRFVHVHLLIIDLRTIWRGINAPTFPFNEAGGPVGNALYLLLVALLWFVVGRSIDRRRGIVLPAKHIGRWRRTALPLFAAAWGFVLFGFCMALLWVAYSSGHFWFRVTRYPVHTFAYSLYFPWSIILIGVGIAAIRRSKADAPRCAF